jgi:hypothetical protein
MLAANMRHADRLDDVRNSRRRARKSWRLESSSHPWLGIGQQGKCGGRSNSLGQGVKTLKTGRLETYNNSRYFQMATYSNTSRPVQC